MFLRMLTKKQVTSLLQLSKRSISKKFSDRTAHYVVTTPIYYVNSNPHIGHAYTSILADVVSRWEQIKNAESSHIFISTGTDEHGAKVEKAAAENNLAYEIKKFCDIRSEKFRSLLDDLNINYGAFVRTTSLEHKERVQKFWVSLKKNGFIESGNYQGWYSIGDEEFVSERFTEVVQTDSGLRERISKFSGHRVSQIKERNYMFNLAPFKQNVLQALESKWVKPLVFAEKVRFWVENDNIMDQKLSISRPTERCNWGIPVPDDPSQTIYVWLDALVSYLTCTEGNKIVENFWPADLQIVGKDILKFHAIYWPAFLLAAGRKLPKNILCHSHWLCEGQKMSKSKGNVVDPFLYLGNNSSDYLKLYLIAQSSLVKDGNFSHQNFIELIDYFANSFGNAVSRVMNRKCLDVVGNMYPYPSDLNLSEAIELSGELLPQLIECREKLREFYEEMIFHPGWEEVSKVLHTLNKFLQDSKFWKRYEDVNFVSSVVYLTFEVLRCCSILLWPITPLTCHELLERLSVRPAESRYSFCKVYLDGADPPWAGRELLPDSTPLVRKVSVEN